MSHHVANGLMYVSSDISLVQEGTLGGFVNFVTLVPASFEGEGEASLFFVVMRDVVELISVVILSVLELISSVNISKSIPCSMSFLNSSFIISKMVSLSC